MKPLILLAFAANPVFAAGPPPATEAQADPYLWLEEVDGEKAVAWARARNKETLDELQADPRYKLFYDRALEVLDASDRIPYVSMRAGRAYNFWQDVQHIKGLWRSAPLADYIRKDPEWEVLLDVDRLSKEEKENWVFQGAHCLPPEGARCFVSLSRGGKDAAVAREFDTDRKAFVEGGFALPESKSGLAWLDRDNAFLMDALSPESVTDSGYPRVVRLWKRGTDPHKARALFEAEKTDVSAGAWCSFRPEGKHCFVSRYVSFYESEHFLLSGEKLKKLPAPADASVNGVFNGELLLTLRSDWKLPDRTFSQNSLVAVNLDKAGRQEKQADPQLVFEPGPRMTVKGISFTRGAVLLGLLDNVRGRIVSLVPCKDGWTMEDVPVPANGSAYVAADDDYAGDFMFGYQDFLTPDSLFYSESSAPIKQAPARFNSSGFRTAQRQALSADGTGIPYFIVYPENMKHDGKNPALLYGYGGFEVSMTPRYASIPGRLWLERGGIYVVANIRGGGEFGPAWHKAALKENRQKAFDDFIAVAEDLVKTGVTSPARLGIEGGSNGGLLVGAMFTQRPELFGAVLCESPLLDMLRYTRLPPGASWTGEYGDPDSPQLRPVIAKYSPYQNIKPGVKYPAVFFVTSSKDDRVHPGHARKAAARLMEFGSKIYYYENIDGGHSAAADNPEAAKKLALEYVLLSRRLMD